MSIPPDAETGPLQAWLDITESATPSADVRGIRGEDRARRISRRVLRATAAATAIAVVLGIAASRTTATVAPATPAATLAAPASTAALTPLPSAAVGDPATMAAAVTGVRLGAPRDLYVDTAVAERATSAGPATIVSVRAVVLPRTPEGWGAPRPARFGVGVQHLDGDPAVVGGPWLLPSPETTPPAAPAWRADDDLTTAATAALRAAGYRNITAATPRHSNDLDGILSVLCRAVGPGESLPRRHDVWLTSDAAHVLGAAGSTAAPPVPMEQP